ncbi:hypothetical protein E2562_031169 [Oryza meyeriana var. granulata]|uniref:Uncharacterized protein n=1 Tax=Oryza meyeriana var. granulata TaxID=110450 RepID=A0A6G1EBW5_9ORYZ|nr:hypothetical protein E2562_031169 [Oryza meyeriana var. granulata]
MAAAGSAGARGCGAEVGQGGPELEEVAPGSAAPGGGGGGASRSKGRPRGGRPGSAAPRGGGTGVSRT